MDILSSEKRNLLMSRVRQRNTKPEIIVRSVLHVPGYRFRLHGKVLPGTPDIILPKYKTVIFVHGCFWHQHEGCCKSRRPTSRIDFWNEKLDKNIERDKNKIHQLNKLGWKDITIWECKVKNKDELVEWSNNEL